MADRSHSARRGAGSARLGLALAIASWGWAPGCFLPGIEPAGLGGAGGEPSGGASAGGSGGSATIACSDAAPCPALACHEVVCEEGSCLYSPTPGVPGPDQVVGDCSVTVCDELGQYVGTADPNDTPPEPPPQCKDWSCASGVLEEVAKQDCDNCCGELDEGMPTLSCVAGACVGCVNPTQCGPGGDCYSWTCNGQVCDIVAEAPGTACGAGSVCVEDQSPFVDVESVSVCAGTSCATTIAACGDFTCDGNNTACNKSCTPIDEALTCQQGASCSAGGCDDCTTCAELPGSSFLGLCPTATSLKDQLVSCFCSDKAPACQMTCADLCNLSFPALTPECLTCLNTNNGCQPEAAACQADIDPTP